MCSNGAWLPGTFFAHFFKDYDHIVRHYQVVQNTRDAIIVKLVPGPHYSEGAIKDMVESLRPYVGETMKIDTALVDEIPMVRTGKRTGVISNLGYDFQKLADELNSQQVDL